MAGSVYMCVERVISRTCASGVQWRSPSSVLGCGRGWGGAGAWIKMQLMRTLSRVAQCDAIENGHSTRAVNSELRGHHVEQAVADSVASLWGGAVIVPT